MEYFAGLDVSLRSCAVCVVDGKGTVLYERELPCEIKDIAGYLTALPVSIQRIGFESGTLSQHLFYGLKAEGFDVVCMEALPKDVISSSTDPLLLLSGADFARPKRAVMLA